MLDTRLFGADVFNDEAMKEYLSPEVYKKMHETRLLGAPLDETDGVLLVFRGSVG